MCLKAIDRYGLVSTRQLKQMQFGQTSTRTMLRRLRLLEKKKLIHRHFGLPNGKLVWTVGQEGLKRIGSRTKVNINKNSLEHDVLVSSVRLALDRAGIGNHWQSGHLLRQQASEGVVPEDRNGDQIPDAIFAVQTTDGLKIVALEVEIVAKSKRRYRKIVDQYRYKEAIHYVWYIIPTPRIGSLILKEVNDKVTYGHQRKFLWSEMADLLANPRLAWANLIDKRQRLHELWQIENSIGSRSQIFGTKSVPTATLTV